MEKLGYLATKDPISSYRINAVRIGFCMNGLSDYNYERIAHIYSNINSLKNTHIYLLFFSVKDFDNLIKMCNFFKQNLSFFGLVPAGATGAFEIFK